MDHGSEEEDKACAGEVSGAKGAGAESAGITGERAGVVGRKRGRMECSDAEWDEDQEGEAARAGEAAAEAAELERANVHGKEC